MPLPSIIEIARADLYTSREDLEVKYAVTQVEHIIRLRDMVTWCIANCDAKDRQFVEEIVQRYGISKVTAYADLKIVKSLKDTKTMEKAATSYAKYNRINVEDETAVPYHMIVVQPFFPTTDPRVVGINPVPNIDERIKKLTKELGAAHPDTLNIEYEEADMNFEEIFDNPKEESQEP